MAQSDKLQNFLKENNLDAFLRNGITNEDSNLYYLTGIKIPDSATYLQKPDNSTLMVSRNLELNRARSEADVDEVTSSNEFVSQDEQDPAESIAKLLEEKNVKKVAVQKDFDLGLAEKLRNHGLELEVVDDVIMESRKTKSEQEIQKIRNVQQTTEKSMKKLGKLLEKADVKQGTLYLDGKVLTAEELKSRIEKFLLDQNCRNPEGMIITSGKASGDPHKRESGEIKAGDTIIADIFPRNKSKYFGDMTRTFVKGDASSEIKQMKEAVEEAKKAALKVLENGSGTKASEVHNAACDVLEEKGYETLRTGAETKDFTHSTGHAVGLDLHEPPKLKFGDDELKPGMILTIEPGLYDPDIGGVRLEDMILVTENGYENFNSMHQKLEVE